MIETIKSFILAHKQISCGLGVIASGVFILIGSMLRWEWLTELGGNEYRNMSFISAGLYQKFGTAWLRIRNIIISCLLIASGTVFTMWSNK